MRFSTLILSSLPCLSSFLFSPLSNTFPCLTSVLLFPPTSLLSDWPHLSSPCHFSTLLSSLPYSFPLSPHLLPHSLPHSLLSLRLFLCNNNNKIYSLNFYFSRNLDTFIYQQVTCYERKELVGQRMEILLSLISKRGRLFLLKLQSA